MTNVKDIPKEFQAHCAVAGDLLDTRVAETNDMVAEYEGKKYYFCCPPCKPTFLANPEQYANSSVEEVALTLKNKEHVVDNIWSFSFVPAPSIDWQAGQYIRVELPHDNADSGGAKRWFTISSAPSENVITITTRISDSSFKQALARLNTGDTLNMIALPSGDFTWETVDDSERIFVIGGIGITPLYSIVKQRLHDKKPLNATLLYANRTEAVPLRDFFDDAAERGLDVQYITGDELTADAILKAAKTSDPHFYISGAKPMVEVLSEQLKASSEAETSITADAFSRYSMENY